MCTLSSCLQNEEPAGIEVLRNAKAELIKAQAQYATAQAALMSAEVAYQELENAEKALDNRLKEAQVAYEEARLELLKAQDAAESEAVIAYWEAEMLKWQNEKEAMIADHEWEMLKKQTAIANAEKEYNEALAALELASASLSDAEEEAINGYRQDIENVRTALASVYNSLYKARTDLLDAKYSFDREKAIAQEQRVLENMQIALTYAQKFYDEAKAVDFQAGNDEWRTKVDELDAQIEEIQKQLDAYKIQAAELENSKKGDEDAIEQIEASIVVLRDQLEKVMAWSKERVSTSIEVPATVAESLRSVFDESFGKFKDNSDATKGPVLTSYYTTVNGVDYTLADGAVAWYATKGENHKGADYYEKPNDPNSTVIATFTGLKTLKEGVAEYVLAPDVLSQVQANLTSKYLNVPTEAEFTAKYNAMVAAKDAYIKLADQYGFDYLGNKMVETGSMWSEALEAVKTLKEQRTQRTLTDAEITALLAQVGEALDVRFSMTGYEQNFDKFPEWADAKEAFVGTEETTVPINFWLDQIYTEAEMEAALGATPAVAAGILTKENDADDVDEADWSPFHKWDSYSGELYGERIYYPLTVEDMAGVAFKFGNQYPGNLPNFVIVIPDDDNTTEDLQAKLDVNGITVKKLKGKVWLQVARAAYAAEQIDALVNNQDDYAAVLASIEEEYDALVAENNATAEERLAINEQIETQEAAKVPYQENIDAIDAQIKALVGEWVPDKKDPEKGDYNYASWTTYGIADAQITRLKNLQGIYENLIENNKVEIPKYDNDSKGGTPYPIGSEDAINAYTDYLEYLAEELAKDEDEITKKEGLITALQNEEDCQTLYIEYCQTNLDMVQAQYDALIAQFNYYNEQLTALLDAITSGEDVPEQPENPETPENPGEGGEETPAA